MIVALFIIFCIGRAVMKHVAKQRELERQHELMLQRQQRALEGEVIDPQHEGPKRNWKVEAAKLGTKVLLSAMLGRHHSHHHHDGGNGEA